MEQTIGKSGCRGDEIVQEEEKVEDKEEDKDKEGTCRTEKHQAEKIKGVE